MVGFKQEEFIQTLKRQENAHRNRQVRCGCRRCPMKGHGATASVREA